VFSYYRMCSAHGKYCAAAEIEHEIGGFGLKRGFWVCLSVLDQVLCCACSCGSLGVGIVGCV
jgi:hypothetical protein